MPTLLRTPPSSLVITPACGASEPVEYPTVDSEIVIGWGDGGMIIWGLVVALSWTAAAGVDATPAGPCSSEDGGRAYGVDAAEGDGGLSSDCCASDEVDVVVAVPDASETGTPFSSDTHSPFPLPVVAPVDGGSSGEMCGGDIEGLEVCRTRANQLCCSVAVVVLVVLSALSPPPAISRASCGASCEGDGAVPSWSPAEGDVSRTRANQLFISVAVVVLVVSVLLALLPPTISPTSCGASREGDGAAPSCPPAEVAEDGGGGWATSGEMCGGEASAPGTPGDGCWIWRFACSTEDGTTTVVSSVFFDSHSVYPGGGGAPVAPAVASGGDAPIAGVEEIGVCAEKPDKRPPDGFKETPFVTGTSTWSCGRPVSSATSCAACFVLALADASGIGSGNGNEALEGIAAVAAAADPTVEGGDVAMLAGAGSEIGVCAEKREGPPVGLDKASFSVGTSTWSCVRGAVPATTAAAAAGTSGEAVVADEGVVPAVGGGIGGSLVNIELICLAKVINGEGASETGVVDAAEVGVGSGASSGTSGWFLSSLIVAVASPAML